MCIMAPDPISTDIPSVCASVYLSLLSLQSCGSVKCIPQFGARQRLGKLVSAATNTCKNIRIVGRVCLWVYLCISLMLLGNNSIKSFPQQRIIVGGIIFCTVCVVSKKSRRLILPRTSCFFHLQLSLFGISSKICKLLVNPTDGIKF
jgi:hypothetical protein